MPKCFIIMPITTPVSRLEEYGGDKDHFRHVLDSLFVPAIEKVGHEAVLPMFGGADLIQAEIIKNLETADLVLCDMSILNANVFFELGIRTAVNKPVCLVRDTLTGRVPFDTSILVHHEYDPGLESWKIRAQIEALSEHLAQSADRSNGENALWRHFGLTTRAELPAVDSADSVAQQQISEIHSMLQTLDRKFDSRPLDDFRTRSFANPSIDPAISWRPSAVSRRDRSPDATNTMIEQADGIAKIYQNRIAEFTIGDGDFDVKLEDKPSIELINELERLAIRFGYLLSVTSD